VQRKAQRGYRITEDSVKLCEVGIEQVERLHEKDFVSSSRIREVSRRRHLQNF
jgi:hypothetical protein